MQIWKDSKKRYGAPKIVAVLRKQHNVLISIRTVSVYMKEIRIAASTAKRYKNKGCKSKDDTKRLNLLKVSQVTRPGEYYLSDITYIWTIHDGWCYLCSYMDIYTRKIEVWDVSKNMTSELVDNLLIKLIMKHQNIKMIHSDQGSQYTSHSYREILANNEIKASYSKKGYPYDNAWIESFHAQLKKEEIYNNVIYDLKELKQVLIDYIDIFYNQERVHSGIGYVSPVELENSYEAKHIKITENIFGIYYPNNYVQEFL